MITNLPDDQFRGQEFPPPLTFSSAESNVITFTSGVVQLAAQPSSALLITTVDIDPEGEVEFNEWYNEIHLPQVLSCPGFIRATRYRASYGEPKYVAIYELETPDALASDEMKAARGWGEMFPFVRNFHERIYSPIFALTASDVRGFDLRAVEQATKQVEGAR